MSRAKLLLNDRQVQPFNKGTLFLLRYFKTIVLIFLPFLLGFLSLNCGPVGLFAGCEAVGRGVPYAASAVHSLQYCDGSSLPNQSTARCPFPKYDRVFVMAQYDDTQIGQFMQESLPRLVYHLDFLLANPDIKIQFGFTKKDNPPISVLPHTYINFLGMFTSLYSLLFFFRLRCVLLLI